MQTLTRNGYDANVNMDNLGYHYIFGTNKLDYISDSYNAGLGDLTNQTVAYYSYNNIGQLTSEGTNKTYQYNALGKTKIAIVDNTTIDPYNQYHSPFVGMGNEINQKQNNNFMPMYNKQEKKIVNFLSLSFINIRYNPINLVDPSGGRTNGFSYGGNSDAIADINSALSHAQYIGSFNQFSNFAPTGGSSSGGSNRGGIRSGISGSSIDGCPVSLSTYSNLMQNDNFTSSITSHSYLDNMNTYEIHYTEVQPFPAKFDWNGKPKKYGKRGDERYLKPYYTVKKSRDYTGNISGDNTDWASSFNGISSSFYSSFDIKLDLSAQGGSQGIRAGFNAVELAGIHYRNDDGEGIKPHSVKKYRGNNYTLGVGVGPYSYDRSETKTGIVNTISIGTIGLTCKLNFDDNFKNVSIDAGLGASVSAIAILGLKLDSFWGYKIKF